MSVLTIITLDAKALFQRIKERKASYMDVFSNRRTKEHFPEIFINRYFHLPIDALIETSDDVMESADGFYRKADDIKWYLMTTQDMPNTVEEKLEAMIKSLEALFLDLQFQLERAKNPDFSQTEDTAMMVPSLPEEE